MINVFMLLFIKPLKEKNLGFLTQPPECTKLGSQRLTETEATIKEPV